MGKIFYLMGKSSSGKDTIYKELLQHNKCKLQRIILYTTRPIREGENDGVEYHFVTDEILESLQKQGKVIECRVYDTFYGEWKYFSVNDEQMQLVQHDYLAMGTLDSYQKYQKYYGSKNIVPIYIEVENGLRLERALKRERLQKVPKYEEMCRRFLADEIDFSEDKIKDLGITKRFINDTFIKTVEDIVNYINDIVN